MSKAILLIRVSTEQQDLVQQREKVVDAAKRDGYDDYIIIEDKESAVKLSEEERNGLNRLKECILNDSSINAVYAYEISRISRQAKIVYSIRDFLIEHHIQLIILQPYFKMLKDNGELSETSNIFFGIFASMAENEGYIRKARMKRGKEKKKALGLHYTGRVPFGYKVDKEKRYILDENTAPLVKRIYEMYTIEDISLRNIVKEMQSQGYFNGLTFHGCVRNIYEVLHREYYTGEVMGYPRIISRELYDKAQEVKKRNTIASPRTENKALLKGLMYNKSTMHMMQGNTSLGAYYSGNGGGVAVKMTIIEPIVWDYVVKLHKEFYSKDYESAIKDSVRMVQLTMRKLATCAEQISEYELQMQRLEERVVLGKISASQADKLEESIITNLNTAKERERRINDDLERYKLQSDNIISESQKQYDYTLMSLDDKISLVKKVIDKIILSRDENKKLHIEIYNKYNDNVENITLVRKWRNWVINC